MATPIEFPNVWPDAVEVQLLAAQAQHTDPYGYQSQIYDHGGRAFRIVVKMQEMDRVDAALMCEWLAALDGLNGTFNFDLDPWYLTDPLPGVHVFQLEPGPLPGVSSNSEFWRLQFAAVEVIEEEAS